MQFMDLLILDSFSNSLNEILHTRNFTPTFAPESKKTKTKNMKKLILSFAVIASALSVNAQTKTSVSPFKLSIGVEAVAPFGVLADITSLGIGATAQGDYNVDPTLALTLNAGYIKFLQKNNNGLELGVIPVLVGIKYYFVPQFYGSAQLGVGIFTSNGESSSSFAYAPGVGYKFSEKFDAGVKYQAYSKNGITNNTGVLRLAYTF